MRLSQRLLTGFFVFAGVMHFVRPAYYKAIMPPRLPYHREAVIVSGVAEIAGGAMVASPATRPVARWWLIGLLAAVFPANVHMAINPDQIKGLDKTGIPTWALWARLPLQPLAIWLTWLATKPKQPE